MWIVVLGELCVFTLFFATFLYYRSLSPELFEASRATLKPDLAALNTIILLASSWCVAVAIRKLSVAIEAEKAIRFFMLAIVCGVAFVVVKVFEYAVAVAGGNSVLTDDFYMFYFMLTGIHLMHLLVGVALLSGITLHLRKAFAANATINSELIGFGSSFWHMIDIVWIVLFPLLYLLK